MQTVQCSTVQCSAVQCSAVRYSEGYDQSIVETVLQYDEVEFIVGKGKNDRLCRSEQERYDLN